MDKLEKHIKEKLEERTIKPSASAWDRIAGQVSVQPKKKARKWYPLAIAASFIGILLVSILFFTSEPYNEIPVQVVDENDGKSENIKEFEVAPTEIPQKELPEDMDVQVANSEPETVLPEKSIKQVELPKSESVLVQQETRLPVQDDRIKKSEGLIFQKVEEVVAQVEILESIQNNVTEAEVDSLLRAAQKQILTDKLFAQDGTVDAMGLLAEVEDELDETFRDQIFDALKDGYLKLRTAVADRNN
jgi:hypothetical protein